MKVAVAGWVGVLLGGCHVSASQGPDGGMPGGDGGAGTGLVVKWTTKPAIPGPIDSNITITQATFLVFNLRVIGDSGSTATTATTLDWQTTMAPAAISFPDAPAGLYSKLTLDLDGAVINPSYEITGTVIVNGVSHLFDIHDRAESKVTVALSATLPPSGSLTLPIQIDFASALGVIDFQTLNVDDGALQLDTNDPQMAAFRVKLLESFQLGPSVDN